MITKAPPLPPKEADPAAREAPSLDLDAQTGEQGFALTSHSLTLSTKHFSLDFTWRRLEVEGKTPPQPLPDQGRPPAKGAAARRTPQEQSFSEVMKRQQLAALLLEPSAPPEATETIQDGQSQPPAFAGPARRAYGQNTPLGPLSGERLYKA
ncbi:hypothetical protein AAU61_05365 [Desulfocarbo indianensis]|nr:hypothetical protein AAU61_05365 [Desulfocarbo indianensis]